MPYIVPVRRPRRFAVTTSVPVPQPTSGSREELRFAAGSVADAGTARAGQSYPSEDHGDQPQHQGRGTTDYSVAGAGPTCGNR